MSSDEVDITKHELVPKHRILSPKEKEEIKIKYRIKKDGQFPRITNKDPVVKAIEAERGDLIEITKQTELGKNVYYRIVVD